MASPNQSNINVFNELNVIEVQGKYNILIIHTFEMFLVYHNKQVLESRHSYVSGILPVDFEIFS